MTDTMPATEPCPPRADQTERPAAGDVADVALAIAGYSGAQCLKAPKLPYIAEGYLY